MVTGLSLGGYLAPRAATAEHRLAACISDCGPYDVFDAVSRRLPGFLFQHHAEFAADVIRLLS
jgi:dipeptidyl aminopeptidase/acylaminoacyl peptidase